MSTDGIEPWVRTATSTDAEAVQALEAAARASLIGARGADRLLEALPLVGEHWSSRFEDPGTVVLVAGIDTVVLGYLCAHTQGTPPIGRIEQVYVDADAREVGLGELLLTCALDELRRAGCRLVDAEALPGDRSTKNLYERQGLTARLITVSRRL